MVAVRLEQGIVVVDLTDAMPLNPPLPSAYSPTVSRFTFFNWTLPSWPRRNERCPRSAGSAGRGHPQSCDLRTRSN